MERKSKRNHETIIEKDWTRRPATDGDTELGCGCVVSFVGDNT